MAVRHGSAMASGQFVGMVVEQVVAAVAGRPRGLPVWPEDVNDVRVTIETESSIETQEAIKQPEQDQQLSHTVCCSHNAFMQR